MAPGMSASWDTLKTLSDPTRVRLLALVMREELSVAELQEILGMGQSRISSQLALLRQAGCEEEVWHLPAELTERRKGPALTSDDLIDFHLLLQQDDWAEGLAAIARDL